MKKQLIFALALSMGAFSFAQKKELKAAEKAIKSSNFAEAKTALSAVEPMMGSLDEKLKSKYYLLKAQALYSNGSATAADIDSAIENLDKVGSVSAPAAAELKSTMVENFLTKGNEAYEGQDFKAASTNFERAYNLKQTDTVFLYYAAATAVNVQEYDRALTLYEKLKDLGYTGIKTEYFATNVETGKEEILGDKNTQNLYVKAKSHIKPGERKTESKYPEIVKNIALIYVSKGDNDKALEAMAEARSKNPEDVNLILNEANIYYKTGNTEKFKELLKQAISLDPNNPELRYNLGVIAAESGDAVEAKKQYEKAVELNPNYVNAYINLSALVLDQEAPLVEEMNGLGTSAADDKRYEELRLKRQQLYKDAIPYLSKALELDESNINAAKTLMNIYSIIGETDKYKTLKAKVETMEAGQ
ncbi:tetratricopeptide repeat protein [Neotamlana laminarinivorans]|uniref:Tetratricopeptide repeat protein n=1 Tax=Neotamlana laminarinivorans TaxID=2883124 RepID=A0A9X1HY38_9FLAO|nr:tetratricopeptide repeat protein [Tamlana laminarinivorans]MCB4797405.1 tetratricopeptide repeat protein [Tamlana laminarinivorans]